RCAHQKDAHADGPARLNVRLLPLHRPSRISWHGSTAAMRVPAAMRAQGSRPLELAPFMVRRYAEHRQGEERTAMRPGRQGERHSGDEQHPHGGDWLREIVFGLNDGLVTTLVFIMTVSAVAGAGSLVLIALSEIVAGGVSMALGGYLSARTEHDILQQRIATERTEIADEPAEERAELRRIYY